MPRTLLSANLAILILLASSASAHATGPTTGHWEARGDRIEHRLDRRGDRIEHRLDRRGDRIGRRHPRHGG